MTKYNEAAVQQAIDADKSIGKAEAKAIHGLLKGRVQGKAIPAEQFPVYSDTDSTVWHVEDYGGSTLEITKTIKGFSFEWLDFDEDAGDWVGVPVAYEDIKQFLPDGLYA